MSYANLKGADIFAVDALCDLTGPSGAPLLEVHLVLLTRDVRE